MKQQYPILLLVLFLALGSSTAFAQQRTISGTIKDTQGTPLPGVNVLVKGTSTGTTSDAEGLYSITVNETAATLVISFIGFATQEVEIGTRTTIDVALTEDVTELSEVVVTALGIERNTRALQYSATQVNGDNFTQARENNLGASLSGRVAGVNVSKVASGPAGSSRVIIRGNKSLGGQSQPLYVVDGIPMDNSTFGDNQGQAGLWGGQDQGDGLSSINPDDIESITVLKGANAAALYGSRGGNGVINIVTKKGTARKGLGIEVNSNFVAETVNNLSDLQTSYGTGAYQGGVALRPTTVQDAFNWSENAWGPKFDPSLEYMGIDGVMRPYVYAGDNWDRFYKTGKAWTNSFAVTGGGEKQTFRFGVSDLRSDAVIPNSGYDRLNMSLNTSAKLGNKVTVTAKVIYSHEETHNRPTVSDSPGNAIQAIWRRPPNININDLIGDPNKPGAIPAGVDPAFLQIYAQGEDEEPKFEGQELLPAANNWGQNPWWAAYQHINDDERDRIITSGQIRYDITDFLYVQGRIGMDWFARRNKQLTPEGVGYQLGGALTEGSDRVREINQEWMLGFNKTFNKVGINAFVGGNKMTRNNERVQANGNGFNVPFQPFINNAKQRNYTYDYKGSGINSLFASAEISYNSYLFLTATARNDWFSVLNPATNDVLYPSVGASFVFTDAFNTMPSWLSFGKVRASWAQVGIANIPPYDANLTYSLNGNSHAGFDGEPRPMGSFTAISQNNANIPNPDLKPTLSTEIEFGIDARFFDNRVGIDLTFYRQRTSDDILRATISRSSGFGTTDVNVGELENKGIEVLLTATPVRGPLTWDISLNLAKNRNKVVSLIPGIKELILEEPRTRNVFIKHIVGQPFGTITGRVQQFAPDGTPLYVMNDFVIDKDTKKIVRDANGNTMVISDGRPLASTTYVPIGNGVPDLTGGLTNSLTYKGFNLSFLLDFKFGGDIFSGSNDRLTQWGLHKQSVIGRDGETPLTIPGVVRVPVVDNDDQPVLGEDGKPTYEYRPFTSTVYEVGKDALDKPIYEQHTGALTPDQARIYWNSVGDESTGITTMFLYDASYIKLRQLTVGYSLPRALLGKTPFQNVTISFVARNLAILYKNIDNVDPESNYSSNAGAQGLEYFGFPSTRSYGFNVGLSF